MPRCALCQEVLPSSTELVKHYGEAHSVARHRQRRLKASKFERHDSSGNKISENIEDEDFSSCVRQSFQCLECDGDFATKTSLQNHQCSIRSKRQPVACQYCGQICKDHRGAVIHQAFCKFSENSDLKVIDGTNTNVSVHEKNTTGISTMFECPDDDCGAMFKNQTLLYKHIKRHHFGEDITAFSNDTPPRSPGGLPPRPPEHVPTPAQSSTPPPLVTVTMKPHIGKTDGLQDLSLLINPTKNGDGTPDGDETPEYLESMLDENPSTSREVPVEKTSITVEELNTDGLVGNKEAILYVAEDGTVLHTGQIYSQSEDEGQISCGEEQETLKVIPGNDGQNNNFSSYFQCSICRQFFLNKEFRKAHITNKHRNSKKFPNISIKCEPTSDDDEQQFHDFNDKDWELFPFNKKNSRSEYRCSLCKRHFLSELGHVKNKECKNKKFKLPRMFSCHFKNCDTSFFKLTELQIHWKIAHKFIMASKNLEFEDEKTFTNWLAVEEDKHKVRFTSDVKRRKPHRTERLLVCHRFHHLRTAAARKNSNKEYSDKHNWTHKIQPCLCFARMKVYQEFNDDTCDYTGKITVVYYYEHSHPKDEAQKNHEEILDHVLQRNKRNRACQFQELKGCEKVLHRQKLEKLARFAGKDIRPYVKSTKTAVSVKRFKRNQVEDSATVDEDQMAAVHVANNPLESDELFATEVEMVFDGQFDMGPEVLSGPVVTHLDSLPMFNCCKVDQTDNREEELHNAEINDSEDVGEESTVQAVLPASTADWGKLFDIVRSRVASEDNNALTAEAAVLLPYERVIDLISPSEQVPIFRQLWELADPSTANDGINFEITKA